MAALPGRNMAVKSGTTTIGFTDTAGLTFNMGTAETTAFGNTFKAFIATIKDVGMTFSGTYDKSDTAQDSAVWTEFLTGDCSVSSLRFYVSASNYFSGTAVITNAVINGEVGGKVSYSATAVGTGCWTYS